MFRRLPDWLLVFSRETLLRFGDRLLVLLLDVGGDLSFRLLQGFLGAIDRRIGLVTRFDELLAAPVFFGMRFGVLDHLLDIGLAQAAGCLYPDALLLAARLVLGRDVDDAVGDDCHGWATTRAPCACGTNGSPPVRLRRYQALGWKYVPVVRLAEHVSEPICSLPRAAKPLLRLSMIIRMLP